MPFIDNLKLYQDDWAYDVAEEVIRFGEVKNKDAISQSISGIIATILGERLFNQPFGTPVWETIFENGDPATGEAVWDAVALAIKTWEDRVTLIEPDMRVQISYDDNYIILTIPYVINQTAQESYWKRKIYQ